MSTEVLERRFARIGARLTVEERPWIGEPRIDVRHDRRGEYFELRFQGGEREVDVEVVDVRRDDRHLLLLVRDGDEKSKFLCGHDERHWFVAAIPEDARGVSGVTAAMRALQPDRVRAAVAREAAGRPASAGGTTAYRPSGRVVLRPGARACRAGLAGASRRGDLARQRHAARARVRVPPRRRDRVRLAALPERPLAGRVTTACPRRCGGRPTGTCSSVTPTLFASGSVRHPDHATIVLRGWHRVAMNTEQNARAMRHVAFLD